jgi:hypothetical protein
VCHVADSRSDIWATSSRALPSFILVRFAIKVSHKTTRVENRLTSVGINTDQIVLSISDGRQPVIKLSGTSYQRQLIDLNRSNPFAGSYVEERLPESW